MIKPKLLTLDYKLPYIYSHLEAQTGGVAVELFHWIKGFSKIGINVGVLTFEGAKKIVSKKINFELIEVYNLSSGIPNIRFIYYRLPKLYIAAKKYNPDFVLQEGATKETGLLAIVAKLISKPFIHRIASDADVDDRISEKLSGTVLLSYKIGLRLADFIFCQNEYQYQVLETKFPNKKIKIVRNPYSINNEIKITGKETRSYVAWIGSFSRVKNMGALLDVVRKCPEINFKIAGKHYNSINEDVVDIIQLLKKCKNVEFVGYINNDKIYDFLKNAYAILNTSILEGFSNTFLEAWSVGTPIITTKNVNPDHIISNFDLGIVANSYDDIANSILKLVNYTDSEFHDLSDRCRKYVIENHNPIELAKKTINIIAPNYKNL